MHRLMLFSFNLKCEIEQMIFCTKTQHGTIEKRSILKSDTCVRFGKFISTKARLIWDWKKNVIWNMCETHKKVSMENCKTLKTNTCIIHNFHTYFIYSCIAVQCFSSQQIELFTFQQNVTLNFHGGKCSWNKCGVKYEDTCILDTMDKRRCPPFIMRCMFFHIICSGAGPLLDSWEY